LTHKINSPKNREKRTMNGVLWHSIHLRHFYKSKCRYGKVFGKAAQST
jgi:hypothetical protein